MSPSSQGLMRLDWLVWLYQLQIQLECTKRIAGNLLSIWSWLETCWSSSKFQSLRGIQKWGSLWSSLRIHWEGVTFWWTVAKTGAICICWQWVGTLCTSSGRLKMRLIDTWRSSLLSPWWIMLESGYQIFVAFIVIIIFLWFTYLLEVGCLFMIFWWGFHLFNWFLTYLCNGNIGFFLFFVFLG